MEDLNAIEAPYNGVPSSVKTTEEESIDNSGKMEDVNVIEAPCNGHPIRTVETKMDSTYDREKKDDLIVGEVHGGVIFDDQIVQEVLEMGREPVTENLEKVQAEEVGRSLDAQFYFPRTHPLLQGWLARREVLFPGLVCLLP
ncbi:hypothetical protein RHGRI_007619 [Rhododendron griersonianum]|uniref:Uncharacterized protein n=1 Tax=Rhododendron griersonianum TaxID=479676 RepID=A0AAV6KY76_9ERIC|nr:hypothetical protein RHGRI_007619 [Rhododendron griersonianum]